MADDVEQVAKRICGDCKTGFMVKIPSANESTWLCEYCHVKKTYPSAFMPKGWCCPRCLRCYSPSIPSCSHCNKMIGEISDGC